MEICTIGGYEEVGKNMTAVKVEDDVIIFDAGIFLPPVVEIQEHESQQQLFSQSDGHSSCIINTCSYSC